MNITDEEKMAMCISSYAQIEEELYNMCKEGDGLPCTLGELYEEAVTNGDGDVSKLGKYTNPLPEGKTGQTYEGSADLSNWEIVDYRDTNTENGFFGMVLRDPDTGDLAVVFRGSETFWEYDNMYEQAKLDWADSDLGLMTSIPTPQQLEAEAFMRQIAESDYYNSADNPNITLLGHSLGGNLAEHAAIVAETCGIDLNRIEHCYSLDGPGYTEEYLEKYATEITRVQGMLTHYRWSIVGNLLNPIPGAEEIVLDVKPLGGFGYEIAGKHGMESVYFDKSGQFAVGKQENWETLIGEISREMDQLPSGVGANTTYFVSTLFLAVIWLLDKAFDKNWNLTPEALHVIILLLTIPGSLNLVLLASYIVIVLVTLAALGNLQMCIEWMVIRRLMELAEVIVAKLGELYQWSQEQMSQLLSYIGETIQDMIGRMQSLASYGSSYVQNHTQIRVDTYKLREYARRLEYLNRMLVDIDLRLDRLYGKTKWTDLGTLLQADLLVRESNRLKHCIEYLNETADSFELAEENILRAFG